MTSPIEIMLKALQPREPIIVVDGGDYGEVMVSIVLPLFDREDIFQGSIDGAYELLFKNEKQLVVVTADELSVHDCAVLRTLSTLGLWVIALVKRWPLTPAGLCCLSPVRQSLGPGGRALLLAGVEHEGARRAFAHEFMHGHSS